MSKNSMLCFLFIYCSLTGCKTEVKTQFKDIDLKDIYIDLSRKHTDFYDISNDIEPDFDIIALETNDACLIGNIRKVIYSNDLYYIQDDKGGSIFIFNNDGTFKSKLDKKGAGPDEYINIASFIVKNNHIWIYDDMSKRLLCYDTIFNKEEEIKIDIPAFDMSIIKDNILLSTNWFWYGEKSFQLKKYNIDNNVITEYSPFSQIKQDDIVPVMKENQFASLGDSCLFMFSYDNKLYAITDDGFIPQYRYIFSERFDDKPLTNQELYMQSDLIRGINALYQTVNNIIIKYDEMGEPMIAIYNKRNGDSNIYTSVFMNSEFGNFKIFRYFITENQEIISLYDPEILIKYGSEIYNSEEISNPSKKQRLDSIMSKADIGDNPIIIKYKLSETSQL